MMPTELHSVSNNMWFWSHVYHGLFALSLFAQKEIIFIDNLMKEILKFEILLEWIIFYFGKIQFIETFWIYVKWILGTFWKSF